MQRLNQEFVAYDLSSPLCAQLDWRTYQGAVADRDARFTDGVPRQPELAESRAPAGGAAAPENHHLTE